MSFLAHIRAAAAAFGLLEQKAASDFSTLKAGVEKGVSSAFDDVRSDLAPLELKVTAEVENIAMELADEVKSLPDRIKAFANDQSSKAVMAATSPLNAQISDLNTQNATLASQVESLTADKADLQTKLDASTQALGAVDDLIGPVAAEAQQGSTKAS